MKLYKKIYHFLFYKNKKWTFSILGILVIAYIFCLPSPLFDVPNSLVLEDKKGQLLGARIAKDGQWRFPATDSIPKKFEAAILEFEDRRFYNHIGIDPIGIGRAIEQNFRNGSIVSGGSTLTMQVIRMARGPRSRNIFNKVIEAILATRLEIKYSKKEILSIYSSHAPFGGNTVGLDAAAWRYFGKSSNYLSWAEAATLAVLPNSPSLIHISKNRPLLKAKRNRLLDRLMAKGKMDTLTCQLAKEEPLPGKPLPLPRIAPHLMDRVQQTHFKNSNGIYSRFKTTLDSDLQKKCNRILKNHHVSLSANGIFNGAILVTDTETGNVLAYVGNIMEQADDEHGHEVNVIHAPRSTGSIIKPLLYASMLQEGELLPSNLVSDVPTYLQGYKPKNYKETYDGAISARKALSRSLNVPAVRLLQKHGLEKFHNNIKNIGLTTIHQPASHYGLPLILGGAEANLWDLTSIYAGMGRTLLHYYPNQGYYDPKDFRPLNYNFNYKTKKTTERKLHKEPVHLGAGAIWGTFEAMQEVIRPTSEGDWELYESSQVIAWKTGTSFGFRDAWAIGVTPRYTVGVWIGNADGEGRPGLVGVYAAAPVLFDIFNYLESSSWFEPPYDDMVRIPVCSKSGFRPLEFCPKIDSLWVPASGLKSGTCPYHKKIHIDKTNKWQVHSDCELLENIEVVPWFVLPPVEEFYYKSKDPSYLPLPPYREDCQAAFQQQNPMQLIYPKNATKIYVPRELDGTAGKTVFKVAHRQGETTIYWHIDNTYMGSTTSFHEMAFNPSPGPHRLTLVDEKGFRLEKSFEIMERNN